MITDYLPLLVPGALGALAALVGAKYSKDYEEKKKSRAARKAILTEIRSILGLLIRRNFDNLIKEDIARLEKGEIAFFCYAARRNYLKIYEANLENIAFLDDATERVVEFYITLNGNLENNDEMHIQKEAHLSGRIPANLETLLRAHRGIQADLELLKKCAYAAIEALETVNRRKIFGLF
jgi:hypothetical protein